MKNNMNNNNNQVTQVYWQPLEKLLNPESVKLQDLSGFDDEFIDIVDYIIRITHRIWEQKNVGLCYQYYGDICPVFMLGGYSECVEQVVQNTLKTIAAFPDRCLIGENVIWRENNDGSYYSSHLITSIMTNTGQSEFGQATNNTGRVTTIADCVCFENKIIKEWLVRDNSFLIKQLGIDVIDAAINFAKLIPHKDFKPWLDSEYSRVRSIKHREDFSVTKDNWSANNFAQAWLQTIFNQKQFSKLHDYYHITAQQQWPGGRKSTGIVQISGTLIQWLAQCPDAKVTVDHIATVPFEDDCIDIAVRWSLAGTYTGNDSRLAALKGQSFFVLAASHLRLKNHKIVQETTVFDEVALYANLIRESGLTLPLLSQRA
ncbi:MAG: hypothetical protein ACI89T_000807 [Cognaticolwellia sp.]|jgi:hypothetical protein